MAFSASLLLLTVEAGFIAAAVDFLAAAGCSAAAGLLLVDAAAVVKLLDAEVTQFSEMAGRVPPICEKNSIY